MNLFRSIRSSPLARQMMRRILLSIAIALVLTIVLSYLLLWPRLLSQSIHTALDLNGEIANQIDSNIVALSDTAKYITHSSGVEAALGEYFQQPSQQNFHRVKLSLNNAQSSISTIRGAVVECDGVQFNSIINITQEDLQWLDSEWYRRIVETHYLKGYTPVYTTSLATDQHSIAYATNYSSGTHDYVLTVFFNAYDLVRLVSTLSAETFNSFIITDYSGAEILLFEEEMPAVPQSAFLAVSDTWIKTSDGYYFISPVDSTGWLAIGFVNHASITATYLSTFLSALILCMLLCVFTICILLPLMYRITYPIKSLADSFSIAAKGDLSVRSNLKADNEIGMLSDIFNDMVASLSRHIENQIVYESNQQKLQYNLLIAQIDPHFIYNTMSIINALARQNRTDDIITINTALIKIMQNYLRIRSLDVSDTVAQELDMVQQYWIIQNMRYDSSVRLNVEVAPEVLEKTIPKNLIQPLVENSLFHGLIDEETGEFRGNIWLSISRKKDNLLIQVSDDGKGIDPVRLAQLQGPLHPETEEMLQPRGRHIGLSNIRRRLGYLYKGKDCVKVESVPGKGTRITLIIPILNDTDR